MNLREVAQEFVKRGIESPGPFYVRRSSWPQQIRVEVVRAKLGASAPTIMSLDMSSTESMRESVVVPLCMHLYNGKIMLVAWWSPSFDDALSSNWDFE